MNKVNDNDLFLMVSKIFNQNPAVTFDHLYSQLRDEINVSSNKLLKILGNLKREHLKKIYKYKTRYKKNHLKQKHNLPIIISNTKGQIVLNSYYGNYKLSNIPFNSRACKTFSRLKIITINDVFRYSKYLPKIISCGEKTIDNISKNLTKFLNFIHGYDERTYCSFRHMLKCILNVDKTHYDIYYLLINSYDFDFQMKYICKEYKKRKSSILKIKSNIEQKLDNYFIQLKLQKFYETVDLALTQYLIAADAWKINLDIMIMMGWEWPFYGNTFLNFCSYKHRYKIERKYWIIFSNDKNCVKCDKFDNYIKLCFKEKSEISELELYGKLFKICRKVCASYSMSRHLEPIYVRWYVKEYLYDTCVYDEKECKYYSRELFEERKLILKALQEVKEPILINKLTKIVNSSIGSDYSPIYIVKLLTSTHEIIFWDVCTIIAKSNVFCSNEFIKELIQELIDEFSSENLLVINVEDFFNLYTVKCVLRNVPNPIALYSLIKEENDNRLILKEYPLIHLSPEIDLDPFFSSHLSF